MGILSRLSWEKLKKLSKEKIFEVFLLNGISNLFKIGYGLVSIKLISSSLGAEGMALWGQFVNFFTLCTIISTGGLTLSGITKFVAQHKDSSNNLKAYIQQAFFLSFWISAFISLFLLMGSRYWSNLILMNENYQHVFIITAFCIFFFSFVQVFQSVFQGLQAFREYTLVGISLTLVNLLCLLLGIYYFKLTGVMLAVVIGPVFLMIGLIFLRKKFFWWKWINLRVALNKKILKNYSHFSLMALVSILSGPLTLILVRSLIAQNLSLEMAGYWEALNKLSSQYIQTISTAVALYYIPRLSEIKNNILLRKEIFKAYKINIPLFLGFLLGIYFFQDFIIHFLFTKDFIILKQLLPWQLLGDFFNAFRWILSYLLWIRVMTKTFIFTELMSGLLFTGGAYLLIPYFGLEGVPVAYAINQFIFLCLILFIFRKLILNREL